MPSGISLVYPLARGSGPLLSFFLAVVLLGESLTWIAVLGVALVVAGILFTLIGTYFGARLLQEKAAPARLAGAVCIVAGVVSLALADTG